MAENNIYMLYLSGSYNNIIKPRYKALRNLIATNEKVSHILKTQSVCLGY